MVAFVRAPRTPMVFLDYGDGGFALAPVIVPLSVVDDWALLADGSIAIVRGRDYRIDRVALDGSPLTSALLPFSPVRLTAEQKATIIDSTKTTLAALRAAANTGGLDPPWRLHRDSIPMSRMSRITIVLPDAARDPTMLAVRRARELPPLVLGTVDDLPDYIPPFRPGSVRADLDGNVWIRTLLMMQGGVVYDVVRARDSHVTRVVSPPGQTIVGFGPRGTVYLTSGEPGAMRLERARIEFER